MIVGTAGHIDHGKTALVQALTGVDADRLEEEQRRGISIDIGFAYAERADGGVTGFVDMPGHEKFMRNMLVGAAGIDCLLLVIAADDGVMPQTREHLAVAELLGVERCLVVISKVDLADEPQIEIVREQIAELLADTALVDAKILPVSVKEPRGLGDLQAALDGFALEDKAHSAGPARFVVDRSFSLPGAGTVVSGMLVQGELRSGDPLLVSPSGQSIRIRSLHAQNRACDVAKAGQRCGIALGGRISRQEISRGDWLLAESLHAPTQRIDVALNLLASEVRPLRHWTAVRFHHGSAEVAARVAILQEGPLKPGQICMAQMVLENPVAAAVNDRFVIRSANGERSLGGGYLVDLRPPNRRRKQPRRLAQLRAMAIADPSQSLVQQASIWPFYVDLERFERDRALDIGTKAILLELRKISVLPADEKRLVFRAGFRAQIEASALETTRAYHQKYPRLLGPGLKYLQRSLDPSLPIGPAKAALEAMVVNGQLAKDGGSYRLPAHHLGLDSTDDALWIKALSLLSGEARFRPPLLAELVKTLGVREFDLGRVLRLKIREGVVVEIGQGRFFLGKTLVEIAGIIGEIALARDDGQFGVADLRDRLANGRKVAIELLEYFDSRAMTARRGDSRIVEPVRLQEFIGQMGEKA